MGVTFLILLLFPSYKQLYIKPETIIGVYDAPCTIPGTGELVRSDKPCSVIVTIGNEYEVVGASAIEIVDTIRGKKKK